MDWLYYAFTMNEKLTRKIIYCWFGNEKMK